MTITPILHHYKNAKGLQRVVFQIYVCKVKLYPDSGVKVKKNQWNGSVINSPSKEKMNALITTMKNRYEGRLLDALKIKPDYTKAELLKILTGKEVKSGHSFTAFAEKYVQEMGSKFSQGRLRQYGVIIRKIAEYRPAASVTEINGPWLQAFENWLHSKNLSSNTISSNVKLIKAIVKAAEIRGLTEANFRGYKNPKVISPEPDFLTEDELQNFFNVARAINKPAHKLAAYYFLLSCFTGLRLGDAKKFNYSTHVQGNEIIVRAKKNGKVVTIPLYPDLSEVLDYLHDKPFLLSEEKARQYVKEISSLAGIKKRVKYHSSRHTAASRFLAKGLSLSETAEIIGDTVAVTKIYAHIDKQKLNEKIMKLMG